MNMYVCAEDDKAEGKAHKFNAFADVPKQNIPIHNI